ncbi:MAG TPA: DUF1552 domain-containing protein [Polyangiaceae bacterium]
MKPISRRTLLRSASGLALGLPFLEAMRPTGASAQTVAPPKRFFVWYTPVGTVLSAWRPTGTGTNWTSSRILKPLDIPVLRERTTILSNCHAAAAEKLAGNGHAKGMTHVLTARPYVDVRGTQFGNEGWGGGISIDQFLAQKMASAGRLNSIEAGVVSFYPGSASRYMSYSGPGQANIVPFESDPRKLFARLFSTGGTSMEPVMGEMDRLAVQRKSVLDTVLKDFNRLNGKLGGADKARLDKHMTLVREVEQRIQTGGGGTMNPTCTKPTAPNYTDDQVKANAQLPAIGKTVMDLLIAGLACDTTRVASIVWSPGESFYNFEEILPNLPWKDLSCPPNVDTCTDGKNLPATFLHVMSHFPPSTANGVPGNMNTVQKAALECLTAVEVWFNEQLAYFAKSLAEIQEADGSSVLDNTVLLSVKDISEGVTHGYRDVANVLLGGKGLFKPGHFNLQNRKTFGDIFATIAQALGFADVTTFGDPAYFTGPVTEIRV